MAYRKTSEQQTKLAQTFIAKNKDKWKEYTLLGEYKNKESKVHIRHNACGYDWYPIANNFTRGHGCPKCGRKIVSKKLATQKAGLFQKFLSEHSDEYTMLGGYVNQRTYVLLLHTTCGTTFRFLPSRIWPAVHASKTRCLCPVCNREKVSGLFVYDLAQANKRLADINPEYEFITYDGAKNLAKIKHKVCEHEFDGKAAYFITGHGHCPKCTTSTSKSEREIYAWVKSVCPQAEQTVHNIEGVTEADILVRDKKVAIEYNGHWWHSLQALTRPDSKTNKPRMTPAQAKKYHYMKSYNCEQQGIRLIHIWDYEWADPRKQKVLKNIILGALGMLKERYYARECEIHRYDMGGPRWSEVNKFFAENNIQGCRGGRFAYMLEKDGRFLMGYKFGRPSGGRAKKLYEYEMARGASAPGVQVIGGASRLWKHFVDEVKPKSVVYYIDYNYFDGRSVEKLGGKFVTSQPGVKNYWVKEKGVKNREPAHHKKVQEAIAKGEVLELWNAGTKTYAFDFPDNYTQ